MTDDTIEGEVVSETSTELAVREPAPAATVGLFNTDNPAEVITRATAAADVLKDVVTKKGLVKNINGREYILVEGWTTLGAMVGVFPKVEYTRPLEDGWEAAVVVVNSQGLEIGRAEAECLRTERHWKNRDDFAIRSMAQTRAMGKALRMPLGFIAVIAGYEATPAEEMPAQDDVPFEPSPAQGRPARTSDARHGQDGTGGAADYAEEHEITQALQLAARVGPDAHDLLVDGLAKQRKKYDNRVCALWLATERTKLREKLPADDPAESQFVIPESAR